MHVVLASRVPGNSKKNVKTQFFINHAEFSSEHTTHYTKVLVYTNRQASGAWNFIGNYTIEGVHEKNIKTI